MRSAQHLTAALLAGSLLAGVALAQLPPTPKTWSRTYGGASSVQGLHDLRQLHGGRLVVAGYTGSFGSAFQSSWLMNIELATGDVRFEQVSNSAAGGVPDSAAVAADGGALFMGRNVIDLFTKHDAWLVRVGPTGAVAWSRLFATAGAGRHFLFDAAQLADGSWIAVGARSLVDQPPQSAWVVRLTAAGGLLWQFEYGGGSVEAARSVTPTSDGGFAIAGSSSSSGAGSDDVWVLKIDAAGAIQWQKTVGGFDADQAEEIVQLDDGGFAVAGSTNSLTATGHAPWIVRLDSSGALLWHKVVDDGVWGDLGAVAKTQDGQLVVVGRVAEPGFQTNDLWCAKFSAATGSVVWQRAYEGELGDFGSAVLPLGGSGFVVGGTWGWGFAGESIWLQRTDRFGSLTDCDVDRTTAFAPVSPAITVNDATTVKVAGTAQLDSVGAQLAPTAAKVTTICR